MKRILSMLMVIATVFVLAACQMTPEKPIVVKKDTERLVEQAGSKEGGTALSELGIPQGRYTFDIAGANGKLHIHVDADILKANVSAMPIVKVSMGLFSQEQVTGIFNYLFPDEKPKYDFGQVETKADVAQELLRLKKQLADGDYDGTEEEQKDRIAQVEEAYQNAPDSAPEGGISDGTLTRSDDSTARSLMVSNNEYSLWISTHTSVERINGSQLPNLDYFCKDSSRTYSTRNMMETDGTNLSGVMMESLVFSYDEAKALCDSFFAAAGFSADDFCVGNAFVIDDTGADEKPGSSYAYRFIYTREVEGCPLFLTG